MSLGGGCASYKRTSHAVDVSALTNVLDIDVDRMVVTAEGGVTMGLLAAATLQRRAVPRVTPEFATFSVSGLGTICPSSRTVLSAFTCAIDAW